MTTRVVILGGGFSGAVVALHLMRSRPVPSSVTIVEPRPILGGGVAYSAPDARHRINVPAGRMSAFSDDIGHFDRWLRDRGYPAADPDSLFEGTHLFPARLEFGRYLDEQVRREAEQQGLFRHVRLRAVSAAPLRDGSYRVLLEDGSRVSADILILALSHPPPGIPKLLAQSLGDDRRLIADPWKEDALAALKPDDRILIMGTGLTMADIVASLDEAGHRGPVTAFSRRGLLPRGHALGATTLVGDFATAPSTTALGLLRRIRQEVGNATAAGHAWQAVLDAVRRDGRSVWQALPLEERRRLLHHLRPFWDVHRYRIAPQPEAALRRWRVAGKLDVLAGSLAGVLPSSAGIHASLRLRRSGVSVQRTVDAIVLATGPSHDRLFESSPLLASLAEAGSVQSDPLGLGLTVDHQSRAIGEDGTADSSLWVAGPLARGTFGELMGLPQVLTHAEQVAKSVGDLLRERWISSRHYLVSCY